MANKTQHRQGVSCRSPVVYSRYLVPENRDFCDSYIRDAYQNTDRAGGYGE